MVVAEISLCTVQRILFATRLQRRQERKGIRAAHGPLSTTLANEKL